MEKPYLFIVTGRPGSGKTTFAQALGKELAVPVLSRDQLKEGFVHTHGKSHEELPPECNLLVTNLFFETLAFLTERGVSVIAEAAFQHALWAERLQPFREKTRLSLCLCEIDPKLAMERYCQRGLDDPRREYFHGDKGMDAARRGQIPQPSFYEAPHLDVPTFTIDTTDGYQPTLPSLAKLLLGKKSC